MSALPHRAPPPARTSARQGSSTRQGSSARRGPSARPRPTGRSTSRPTPRPRRLRVAALVAVVVVGVLAIVGIQAQAAEVAFDARALEQEIAELERSHEQLTAEVASLESPERLRRVALDELGMVQPETATYLDLSEEGRLATAEAEPPRPVLDPVKEVTTLR